MEVIDGTGPEYFISVPSSSGKSLQLHTSFGLWRGCIEFQSPLHRGNHFNGPSTSPSPMIPLISVPSSSGKSLQLERIFHPLRRFEFQSPLHRGNHFNVLRADIGLRRCRISVPSSSGKSLQRANSMRCSAFNRDFSPLFIGEITSTDATAFIPPPLTNFSPLFIGEITSTPKALLRIERVTILFQSPLHRGNHFN